MRRRAKAAALQVGQRGYARSITAVERAVVVQVKPLLVETATGRVVACSGFWAAHEFIPEQEDLPASTLPEPSPVVISGWGRLPRLYG